jgi:hypothetical protein
VRILVEVVGDSGRRVRKQKGIEVHPAVLREHMVVCEGEDELLSFVLDGVVSSALEPVSRAKPTAEALEEAIATGGPTREGGGKSKLDSMLGLDIIEHMDGLEARQGGGQPRQTPGDLALPQTGTRRR